MESYVAQPGEPILTFGSPAGGKVSVAQQRFFLSPSNKPDPAQKWTVPVCFKAESDKRECEVLTPEAASLKTPSSTPFFANAGGTGYYRVAYAPADYAALVASVETALKPTERISLLGGEWAQVRANKAPVGDYLDLVTAVKADTNAAVLGSALGGVSTTYARIAGTEDGKERPLRMGTHQLRSAVRQAALALAQRHAGNHRAALHALCHAGQRQGPPRC